jgi:hypothetical protein
MHTLASFLFMILGIFLTNASPTRHPDYGLPSIDQYLLGPDASNFTIVQNICQDPDRKEIIDLEFKYARLMARAPAKGLDAQNHYVRAFIPAAYQIDGVLRIYEQSFKKMGDLELPQVQLDCRNIRDCVDVPNTIAWTDNGQSPAMINFCDLWFTLPPTRVKYDDCIQNRGVARTLTSLNCRGK